MDASIGKLLAEIMRLQRFVGSDMVSAATIYGLENGFESILREVSGNEDVDDDGLDYPISRETQEKAEDILEAVDNDEQSPVWMHIKDELRSVGIDESDFLKVMDLCLLQSRWGDAIAKIKSPPERASVDLPEVQWAGAMYYMEICPPGDTAPEGRTIAMFGPCISAYRRNNMPRRRYDHACSRR